jgi:acetyltransferase-like isoleucine patch superfamily enzyme
LIKFHLWLNKKDIYLKIRFVLRIFLSLPKKIRLKNSGEKLVFLGPSKTEGLKWASFGNRVEIQEYARIEVFQINLRDNPSLSIGNNVSINPRVHIGCINNISIGDNCLLASNVYITDHSHGDPDFQDINTPPSRRPIMSKGPVIIENNVWLGENSVILPNVIIGRNSIIGANAVVTKSIPPYSVAAGVPAKVIRKLEEHDA